MAYIFGNFNRQVIDKREPYIYDDRFYYNENLSQKFTALVGKPTAQGDSDGLPRKGIYRAHYAPVSSVQTFARPKQIVGLK